MSRAGDHSHIWLTFLGTQQHQICFHCGLLQIWPGVLWHSSHTPLGSTSEQECSLGHCANLSSHGVTQMVSQDCSLQLNIFTIQARFSALWLVLQLVNFLEQVELDTQLFSTSILNFGQVGVASDNQHQDLVWAFWQVYYCLLARRYSATGFYSASGLGLDGLGCARFRVVSDESRYQSTVGRWVL